MPKVLLEFSSHDFLLALLSSIRIDMGLLVIPNHLPRLAFPSEQLNNNRQRISIMINAINGHREVLFITNILYTNHEAYFYSMLSFVYDTKFDSL